MLLVLSLCVQTWQTDCQELADTSDTSDTCTMIIMINIIPPQPGLTEQCYNNSTSQMVGNREKILNCQPGISIEQLGDDKFLFDQSSSQLPLEI